MLHRKNTTRRVKQGGGQESGHEPPDLGPVERREPGEGERPGDQFPIAFDHAWRSVRERGGRCLGKFRIISALVPPRVLERPDDRWN